MENRLDVSMLYHRLQVALILVVEDHQDKEDFKDNIINTEVVCHQHIILMAAHQLADGNHHQVLINTDLKQVGTMVLLNINKDIHLTVIKTKVNQRQHLFNQNHQLQRELKTKFKKLLKINKRVEKNGPLMVSIQIYQKAMMNKQMLLQRTQT